MEDFGECTETEMAELPSALLAKDGSKELPDSMQRVDEVLMGNQSGCSE